jgi:hypothetical protein
MTGRMPKCRAIIYRTEKGRQPVVDWLKKQNKDVQTKAVDLAKRLKKEGEDLKMPFAKLLRDGIYELRISSQNIPYRILYSFVGKSIVLLTNGTRKEGEVPPEEIEKAITFRNKYLHNPKLHTGWTY